MQKLPPPEGKLNPPKYSNMDSSLNRIVQQVESLWFTARAAAAGAPVHREESVAVTLYITEGYADVIATHLESNGASLRNTGIDYIEAYIPVPLLAEASQREGVISVRTIIPPQPAQGAVVSEGAAAHGAPAWHAAGLKRGGVIIGVIDTGFEGFQSLMATELPSTVEARCYTLLITHSPNLADCEVPSIKHGTAVTEALFDIAPDAAYYIANPLTRGDLQAAVQWMADENVDGINMSMKWSWDGPGDGTSPFSDSPLRAVDAAISSGAIWVNSSGNSAWATWFGSTDKMGLSSDSFDFQVFDGSLAVSNCVDLASGELLIAQLRWDDAWGSATRDLDLVLFDSAVEIVAASLDVQSGGVGDDPFEYLIYVPVVGGEYCLVVVHNDGPTEPAWIQLQSLTGQDLEFHTLNGSIDNPAESANPGLLAVGAAPWDDTYTIERFRSRGPTPDGRIKPDVVGTDGGKSVSYRTASNPDGNLYGTSQASAYVAGLAALVKQRFPGHTPQQVAQYLKNRAEPRGDVPNNTWGYGFAALPASDAVPPPEPTPETDSCVEPLTGSATVSGSWASDCESESRTGSYARFYTFSLTEAGNVTITLESDKDPYLYLLPGTGDSTIPLCENDDYDTLVAGLCDLVDSGLDSTTDSGISAHLDAGDYTVEATTYNAGETGDFTLTVTIGGAVAPPPTPVPLPPDYDIEDHACNAEDLTHLGSFTLESDLGPETYTAGYDGIAGYYRATWDNAQTGLRIV